MTLKSDARLPQSSIATIISNLQRVYSDAKCALSHQDPLELLVATILSAQCTDVRVNIVTKSLFKKYRSVTDYAAADPSTFESEIHSTGFFKNKTKSIISCAKALVEKYDGKVPRDMESLTSLPGVGRKTANVVLGTAFGIAEGIVVDTHVKRLSFRIGLSDHEDPEKIEQDLMRIVPRDQWIIFSHLLVFHGRNRCGARKPDCPGCEIASQCLKRL